MSAAVKQLSQVQPMLQPEMEKQSSPQQQQLTFTTTRYRLRCTSHELFLNDEPISYSDQILNLDKFYVIKTLPNSQLKAPIILHRNKQIDSLDRRIFTKKFVFEIVKSLQICSFPDAAFICQRIPKQVKYFVTVIQGITQFRWKMLIMNDTFYLAFYSCLESLITKKSLMSPLRRDILEDLLKCNMQNCHSRLFYMLDTLVLENEDLRNTVINLSRNIVIEEMQKKRFFQQHILGENLESTSDKCMQLLSGDDDSGDGENSGIEDNFSTSDRSQNAQETISKRADPIKVTLTRWPQNLLQNVVNVTRSCLRLKLPKEFICNKIINKKFLLIVKQFFKESFQTQRSKLLQALTVVSQIQPLLMWTIVFEEGKNQKNRNLKFLELLLTGSMMKIGGLDNQASFSQSLTYSFLQKLITLPYSPELLQFLHSIFNTFLSEKFIIQELEQSLRQILGEEVSTKLICDMWKSIVRKIEKLINALKVSSELEKQIKMESSANNKKSNAGKPKQRKQKQSSNIPSLSFTLPRIHLPVSKVAVIILMKIYKVLIKNQKFFYLQLDLTCIDYLLSLTKHRKGAIESARLSLIETIERGDSIGEQMSVEEQ